MEQIWREVKWKSARRLRATLCDSSLSPSLLRGGLGFFLLTTPSSQLPKPHLPALSPCLRTIQDFLLLKTFLFSLCILAICDPLRWATGYVFQPAPAAHHITPAPSPDLLTQPKQSQDSAGLRAPASKHCLASEPWGPRWAGRHGRHRQAVAPHSRG